MRTSELITVVVPVYNRAHTIGRTLRTIDAQTVRPYQVILVDNASTDASLSILKGWAESRPYARVLTESRRGACAARNRGLSEVTTPWVMFFDSDDVMLPDHVGDFDDAIRRNPSADILGRAITAEMPDGSLRRLAFTDRNPLVNHILRSCLSTQRIVTRTPLVRAAGGWDERLTGWDDYELGVRLLLAGGRPVDIGGEPTVRTCFEAESLTGSDFSHAPSKWEPSLVLIRRHLAERGMTEMLRWVDVRSMILAAQYAREGAADLAASLAADTLAHTSAPRRMRLIYHHNRLFNRLTWVVARLIL